MPNQLFTSHDQICFAHTNIAGIVIDYRPNFINTCTT